MTGVALAARAIGVRFGGVVACDDIDLLLGGREIVGLTGPNGSGKSTFLNAVTGLVDATGSVEIGGRGVPFRHARTVRQRGVARLFQTPQFWTDLSTIENVTLGSDDRRALGLAAALAGRREMRRRERARWEAATRALERVGLDPELPSSALPYGQQRLVELARAIVGRPSVLLLDEPSAGLNEPETRQLAKVLSNLRDEGAAILVVDHKIDFLDSICDRIVVLQLGRVIAEGTPAEIWRNDEVVAAYLGVADGGTPGAGGAPAGTGAGTSATAPGSDDPRGDSE